MHESQTKNFVDFGFSTCTNNLSITNISKKSNTPKAKLVIFEYNFNSINIFIEQITIAKHLLLMNF